MSRKTTILLAILLFACLAVAIFVGTPDAPVSPVPPLFLEFARSEVKAVDVKNPLGEVHLERDGKDRERWRVRSGNALVRAASERVEDILNDLSRLAPKNYWKKEAVRPEERKAWGVEAPALTVTLSLEGRTVRASFGGRTLEKENIYGERDGNGDVYVVPSRGIEALESARTEGLRERRPLGFSTYDAKTLSLRRDDGLVLEAERAPGRTWEVAAPFRGAADPGKMDDFLAKVLNLEAAEFVADGAPDLDRYGLLAPRAVISVRREGREAPVVVKIGKEAPGGKHHFTEEGEPSVYACGPELPDAVAKLDPAALRDRNLLRIGWAKIDAVEVVHPEKGWKLLRVLDRWDLEKPERVPAEGTEVEALLDELRKLEAARFLDGEDPAKHGLGKAEEAPLRLVLTGADEAGHRTLLLGARDGEGNVPARLLPGKGDRADPPVVLLPGTILDRLAAGALAFRSREVLQVDMAEVRGLARSAGGVVESYDRAKDGTWTSVAGGKAADREALTAALTHLLNLRCTAYEARAKEGLETWGLGEPPAGPVVTIRLGKEGEREERTRTLVLGSAPDGGGSHYARLADGDLVFRLPDHFVKGADVIAFFEILTGAWAK